MSKMRRLNRMAFGGAMAINTAQLMTPGANTTNVLQGSVGIGVAGAVSDSMFGLLEKQERQMKKRRR